MESADYRTGLLDRDIWFGNVCLCHDCGVNNGWLNKEEYAPVARRAWLGLCNYINDKNDLTEVCVGTGKKNSKQYYMDRPRIAGDYHGQAPIIWCAYALLNK